MDTEALANLAKELTPYLRPLGYVPPPCYVVQSLRDRAREPLNGATPTALYCWTAVNAPNDRALQTLALILDV